MIKTVGRTPFLPIGLRIAATILGCLLSVLVPAQAAAGAFVLVPEMETPPGVTASSRAERALLAQRADADAAVAALRDYVTRNWPEVRAVDAHVLSRYHREVTRGWPVPAEPGELAGRVIGQDDGALFVKLRGPRLPASFDIVHRHLTFYARYTPDTGALDRVALSIHLEVFE